MTDVYVEDPDDEGAHPGALARMRVDLARTAQRLESLAYHYASDAADETRMLAHRARRRINRNLGTAALAALGAGLALGLLAAAVSAWRRRG